MLNYVSGSPRLPFCVAFGQIFDIASGPVWCAERGGLHNPTWKGYHLEFYMINPGVRSYPFTRRVHAAGVF